MTTHLYVGDGVRKHEKVAWRTSEDRATQPQNYLADQGLIDACNVALLLRKPLLLTGKPGTGKTQFARSMAWEIGLGEPLKFETKSTSDARDLYYTYDALQRFQDAQSGPGDINPAHYLTFQALGIAIIRTRDQATLGQELEFRPSLAQDQSRCRSVVLIDEVDKAPRDFPNDILNELEGMYFRIPEMGNIQVRADPDPNLRPIVVFTSNSEKDLPDAFLRRCIYYDIPFPDDEKLRQIIAARIGLDPSNHRAFLQDALALFHEFQEGPSGIRKQPGTAELLDWMRVLNDLAGERANPLAQPDLAHKTLSALVKTQPDQAKAVEILQQWTRRKETP